MIKFISDFNFIYLVVAFLISVFYGIYGEKIFRREQQYNGLALSKKVRKFIIHFSGSAIGFLALYYLIKKAMFCISSSKYDINITDVLLLIIGLLGICGHLQAIAYNIEECIGFMIDKLIKFLSPK